MLKALFEKAAAARTIRENIVVIDSVLPSKNAIGPRNSDLLEFVKKLPGFAYYTMYPMKPGKDAWFSHGYGMAKEDFKRNLKNYVAQHPEAKGKIKLLFSKRKYQFNLAYTYFLAETYTLLPFLEKHKIPFVFLLNPGGAFGLNNESSDAMLRKVCSSKFFRKVIVNQRLFKDYLLNKGLCRKDDVLYDFSGSAQFKLSDVKEKRKFKREKSTFDICFVAAKYSPKGVDKGYDLFVAAAKRLAKYRPDIRFHVVGGFDETEIDVSDIKDVIKFYGYLDPVALPEFYSTMDIFMSPNRPFKLYEGNSDGFPLSAGAMYCGVCGFNADELNMNTEFAHDEVVIIKTQVKDIVEKVKHFYNNLDELYAISQKGQKKAQFFYDIEKHIEGRIHLFRELIGENA
ncbi:MAG TPA: glycosyltransferase [Candidatus Saccharimonadales bacterium]|nr:glycosyltransferase [Candidatus Saccharimonadales bacterium]